MRTGRILFSFFLYTSVNFLFNSPIYASSSDNNYKRAQQAIVKNNYSQAEIYLIQWLKLNDNDWDAKFLLARVYAWQDKYQHSHEIYDELLKQYPNNSDYLLGKAQVYIWNNNPQSALPLLSKARVLSPNYREIWRLELYTLKRLSDKKSRILYETLLAQAKGRFEGEDWLISFSDNKINNSNHLVLLGVEGRIDKLSDNLPSWYSYGLKATLKSNQLYSLHSRFRATNRFDQKDKEINLGAFYKINSNWFFGIDTTYSPSYNVLPHQSYKVYLGRNFANGYNIQVGNTLRRYKYVDSLSKNFIFERYFSNYRFRYTLYIITIDGNTIDKETERSYSVNVEYYYTDINSIGLSIANGKELEYDGSPSALVTDIKNFSIYGTHWLQNSNWAPKYQFEYQQQGNYYSRYGFYFCLLYKF